MDIGRTSIHVIHDSLSTQQSIDLARRVEAAGYGALWMAETFGREVFAHSAHLLANTETLVVGTGIANIYARDATTMAAGQATLAEQSGGRFLLGIGVSHSLIVTEMRGHEYGKPVSTMRAYLETMDERQKAYGAPAPAKRPERILAALRPGMLRLAASHADGAMPVWVPPEHTARARAELGPDKYLCPIQYVMLETDAAKARAAARVHCGLSMTLPNYQENLKWLGFTSEDFENGCSDRLIDAVFCWGDERAIRERIDAHIAAGADHVCIGPASSSPSQMLDIDMRIIDMLAPNKD